jgi:hypothetical protein
MVARGVSSDDGDSGAADTDFTLRVQRVRVGPRVLLLDGDGRGDLLLVLSHVQSAGPL